MLAVLISQCVTLGDGDLDAASCCSVAWRSLPGAPQANEQMSLPPGGACCFVSPRAAASPCCWAVLSLPYALILVSITMPRRLSTWARPLSSVHGQLRAGSSSLDLDGDPAGTSREKLECAISLHHPPPEKAPTMIDAPRLGPTLPTLVQLWLPSLWADEMVRASPTNLAVCRAVGRTASSRSVLVRRPCFYACVDVMCDALPRRLSPRRRTLHDVEQSKGPPLVCPNLQRRPSIDNRLYCRAAISFGHPES